MKQKRLKFGHGYCINERDDEHNSANNVIKRKGNQLSYGKNEITHILQCTI